MRGTESVEMKVGRQMKLADDMEIRHTSTLSAPASPLPCMRVEGTFRFKNSVDRKPSPANAEDGEADMQHMPEEGQG